MKKLIPLLLISLFFIPSHASAERKESVVVLPLKALDLSKEFRDFLTKAFIGQLTSTGKYDFVSGKIVRDAVNATFQQQKKEGFCDEIACLREVAGNFGTNYILSSGIVKEGDIYFLNAQIEDISSGAQIAQADDMCKNCDLGALREKFKTLALTLMGEKAPAQSPSGNIIEGAKTGDEAEKEAWAVVKTSTNIEDIQDFLSAFPDGIYAPAAKMKLKKHQRSTKAGTKKPAQNRDQTTQQGGKRSSDGRYIDHGDGTIKDTKTGLIWAKADSYVATGKCKDWDDSRSYVSNLSTGGFSDWRLPTIKELQTIYEKSKKNKAISGVTMHVDPLFASGGAYWYWSSEEAGSCCARYINFSSGIPFFGGGVYKDSRSDCYKEGGVRAVR